MQTAKHYPLVSEDKLRPGCLNVSYQQQLFCSFENYPHPDDHSRRICCSFFFLSVFSTYCLLHYLRSLLKLAPIVVQHSSCHFPAMLREWKEGLLQLQVVKWLAENGSKWREKDRLKCRLIHWKIMDYLLMYLLKRTVYAHDVNIISNWWKTCVHERLDLFFSSAEHCKSLPVG